MIFYLKTRAVPVVASAVAATLALLCWPGSALAADVSPMGASAALAVMFALVVPTTVSWACSRSDPLLERCGVRPIAVLDCGLVLLASLGTAAILIGMTQFGLAVEGARAARALIVFTGLVLIAEPVLDWSSATLAPATYLALVLAAGRGSDIQHPAPWAFVAAAASDSTAWAVSVGLLVIGIAAYSAARTSRPIGGIGAGRPRDLPRLTG